jgi:dienelactone hydrolase
MEMTGRSIGRRGDEPSPQQDIVGRSARRFRRRRLVAAAAGVLTLAALGATGCGGSGAAQTQPPPSGGAFRDVTTAVGAIGAGVSPEFDVTWVPSEATDPSDLTHGEVAQVVAPSAAGEAGRTAPVGAEATESSPAPAPSSPGGQETISVVGVTHEVFVDSSRPTNAVEGVVQQATTRTLPTTVWYPAAVSDSAVDPSLSQQLVPDAQPDVEGGPYPLIELSHGLTGHASDFTDLASVLAASGYVVVSPDFPETTGGSDARAFPNFVHQPGDVLFTIEALLALSADPASRFHGLIDPTRIGIGGRSLGAATTMLTLYNTRFGAPQVLAAVSIAGLELPVEGATFDYEGKPPLLAVHSDADPTVPYTRSLDIYEHARAPKFLLTLKGQGHANYFDAADPWFPQFSSRVLAFYDVYVKGATTVEIPTAHDDAFVRIEGQAS